MFGTTLLALILVLQIQYSLTNAWCFENWGQLAHDPYTYDPCLDGNYQLITDHTRSADYYDSDSPLINDDYNYFNNEGTWEKNGWYRSVIPGAEDIALARPEYGHCQAERHLYFDAEYNLYIYDLNEVDDFYEIDLSHSDYGCCHGYFCMKQCDSFNVYQLGHYYDWWGPGEGRLCFGGDGQCPEDHELCKQLFKSRNRPTISYNSQQEKVGNGICKEVVQFVCQVTQWANGTNVNKLQFTWSAVTDVDDMVTIVQEVKQGLDQSSILTMEQIQSKGITKGNFELGCEVQWSTNNNGDTFGEPVSTTFHVGLEISHTDIQLTEGQHSQDIALMSTVPLGCEYPCSERATNICTVEVPIVYHEANQIVISSDENYEDTGDCEETLGVTLRITGKARFGETLNVPMSIYPKDDGKYDGTQHVDVQLGLDSSDNMWNGLTFTISVLVHDINSDYGRTSCSFVNDPHVQNFDESHFELQLEGVFKLMRHLHYPIDIEGYFKSYGGYTGVCGVAVRSGGSLYVVRYCRTPVIAKFYGCDSSSPLIVDRNGRQFDIYLPTGTKVEFTEGHMNIYPSAADRDNIEGICGNYNGDRSDDFIIKSSGEPDLNTYEPNEFSDSWRIKGKSLFQGEIHDDDSRSFEDTEFCECDTNGIRRCGALPRSNIVIKGTDVEPGGNCREYKRSIVYTDYVADEDEFVLDYDLDFVASEPEWKNGWSQDTAEEFCNDYFSSKDILQSCAELIDIDSGISNCFLDIHITGTTDYTKTQLDMLLSQCINEVEKYDIVNADGDSSYTNPYQNLLESVCYSDCNGNGFCENGVCQCQEDYAGHDCSVDKNHIPTLQPFYFSGLCDKMSRPCQDTAVYADLLLDSDNLKCRVQPTDVSHSPVSEAIIYDGVMEHFQKVFCHIPEHTMPYIVSIAVTNNDRNYSEPQPLLVYHSTCWHCSLESGCDKKKSSCVINTDCVTAGESNPSNVEEHCDPELDEYGWSAVPTETTSSGKLNQGAIIGIAVAAAIVIISVIVIIAVLCKHNSKKSERVSSELDLGKSLPIVPKSLEENQNGMPPAMAQVDFKTMNLYPDVTPNNRLAPLPPKVTMVRPAENTWDHYSPAALQVDTLPNKAKV